MRRTSFGLALRGRRAHRRAGRARRPGRRRRPPAAPAARPRPSTRSPPRRRSTPSRPAATPSTPRSPRPACSASPSRSRAASAAAASWSSAPPSGKVTTIDGRETAPARDAAGLVHGERRRHSQFDDARFSGLSAGVPGTPLTWARALSKYGTISLRRGAAARHPRRHAAASRSTRRSSTGRRGQDRTSTTSRRPPRSTSTPTARRATSARRSTNPDMAKTYRILAARASRKGFYRGAGRRGDGRGGGQPADRPDRQPHVAHGPDDHRRPQALHGARARADRVAATAA